MNFSEQLARILRNLVELNTSSLTRYAKMPFHLRSMDSMSSRRNAAICASLASSERNALPIVFIDKLSPNFAINRFKNRLGMLDPTDRVAWFEDQDGPAQNPPTRLRSRADWWFKLGLSCALLEQLLCWQH